MSLSVTLSRNQNGIATNSVTVSRGVSQDQECHAWRENWNSSQFYTADGAHLGFNNGTLIIRGLLKIDLVSKAEADSVKAFFVDSIRFIRPFIVNLSNAGGADFGNGVGQSLSKCYLDMDDRASTEMIVQPLGKAGKYTIRIPFICVT